MRHLLIFAAINVPLTVARLHDTGSSGWWSLLLFVPFVNLVVWIYLLVAPSAEVLTAASGDQKPVIGAGGEGSEGTAPTTS